MHRDEAAKAHAALEGRAKKLGAKHRKASEEAAGHEESAAKMRKKARALLKAKKVLEASAAARDAELDKARDERVSLVAQLATAEATHGALHAELGHYKGVLRPASEATVLRAVEWAGEFLLFTADILCESCSQFDLPPP